MGGLEGDDGVAQEGLGPHVPLLGRGVDERVQHEPGVVDAHVHDHVEAGGGGEPSSAAARSANVWAVVATSTP